VRTLYEILSENREPIVEDITRQISCYRPSGNSPIGPAEITSRVGRVIEGFMESVAARRVSPFVDEVRSLFLSADESEGFSPAEAHMVLDLIEDRVRGYLGSGGRRERLEDDLGIVEALFAAGRNALPRDSRYEPEP
jgi:hypothetical protein